MCRRCEDLVKLEKNDITLSILLKSNKFYIVDLLIKNFESYFNEEDIFRKSITLGYLEGVKYYYDELYVINNQLIESCENYEIIKFLQEKGKYVEASKLYKFQKGKLNVGFLKDLQVSGKVNYDTKFLEKMLLENDLQVIEYFVKELNGSFHYINFTEILKPLKCNIQFYELLLTNYHHLPCRYIVELLGSTYDFEFLFFLCEKFPEKLNFDVLKDEILLLTRDNILKDYFHLLII